MNNWPECIDSCYGASLGPEDSRGHNFIYR